MKIFECTRLCVYVSLSSAPTTPRWLGGRPADSGRRLRRSVAVELAGDSARRLLSGNLNTNRMCSTFSAAARDVLNAFRTGCAQRHPHGMCSMLSALGALNPTRVIACGLHRCATQRAKDSERRRLATPVATRCGLCRGPPCGDSVTGLCRGPSELKGGGRRTSLRALAGRPIRVGHRSMFSM